MPETQTKKVADNERTKESAKEVTSERTEERTRGKRGGDRQTELENDREYGGRGYKLHPMHAGAGERAAGTSDKL